MKVAQLVDPGWVGIFHSRQIASCRINRMFRRKPALQRFPQHSAAVSVTVGNQLCQLRCLGDVVLSFARNQTRGGRGEQLPRLRDSP